MFEKLREIIESDQFKVSIAIFTALAILYRFYVLHLQQEYYSSLEATKNISDSYDKDIVKERVFDYIGEYYPESSDEDVMNIVNDLFDTSKKVI